MAKSKRLKNQTKTKRPRTHMIQARLSEQEHGLLLNMCKLFGNTVSQRLRMIVHQELEEGYPMAFVEFNGTSHQTWLLIEKREVPVMKELFVLVLPEDAYGIFPEAFDHVAKITMPRRSPGIFAVTPNRFQDTNGVWHLHLQRVGQVPA